MPANVIDTVIHQWTADPGKMKDLVPTAWQRRLEIKSQIQDPVTGSLVPTVPWQHAFWNEDAPEYDRRYDEYTNSKEYTSPSELEGRLREQGVEYGILTGHEMKFLPALPDPQYASELAKAYNTLIKTEWLAATDAFKGAVLVHADRPSDAAEEISKYADDPDMVSVLLYGGGKFPLGHDYLEPIYEAATTADMPLMIHTSGNAIHHQTALGLPEHYVTFDTNLAQNHMSNMASLIFHGVLDRYPDLDVIWAGAGVTWVLHWVWRATRYWRNIAGSTGTNAPRELRQDPMDYIDTNFYFTTYPLEAFEPAILQELFEMVGTENVLFGSGYPHWDHDGHKDLPVVLAEDEGIMYANAARLFGL